MDINLVTGIGSSVLILIKIAIILFLIFYLIFAGVIIKQARVMTETIKAGFEGPIRAIVFVHFVFSLITLFLAIIIL